MIAGPHRHLALAVTTIDAMTAAIVANHPQQGNIAIAAIWSLARHLTGVLRHARRDSTRDRAVLVVITTTDEVIHGSDTGIATVGQDVCSSEYVSSSCPSVLYFYHRILENPATLERSSMVGPPSPSWALSRGVDCRGALGAMAEGEHHNGGNGERGKVQPQVLHRAFPREEPGGLGWATLA